MKQGSLVKSNLSLYSQYYAAACNEFAGLNSASLRLGNTAPFKEILQWWQAVGNFVSDLTGLRFEPQTSRFKDEYVTPRPTGRPRFIVITCFLKAISIYRNLVTVVEWIERLQLKRWTRVRFRSGQMKNYKNLYS